MKAVKGIAHSAAVSTEGSNNCKTSLIIAVVVIGCVGASETRAGLGLPEIKPRLGGGGGRVGG